MEDKKSRSSCMHYACHCLECDIVQKKEDSKHRSNNSSKQSKAQSQQKK